MGGRSQGVRVRSAQGEERPRFVALVPHPQRFCAVRLAGPPKTMFFADRPIIRLASVALNEEERTQPNQGFEPMLGFIWSSTREEHRCIQLEEPFTSLLKASSKPKLWLRYPNREN
jgi:hypothetical protein